MKLNKKFLNRDCIIAVLSVIIFSAVFLLVSSGCFAQLPIKFNDKSDKSADESIADEMTQEYANDFTLTDLDGNIVSLHDYKGKIVVLNFWATWCPPCQAEIPDFVEVYNIYKDKGVQFFGVSDDFDKSLASFAQQYNINYPTLLDSTDKVFKEWKIDAIPHTFILDGNGNIVFDQLGMMSRDLLINAIEDALRAQK